MCDSEKKMVEDLKEGSKDIIFSLSLARSEVVTVRKTIARILGRPELKSDAIFQKYCKVVNS